MNLAIILIVTRDSHTDGGQSNRHHLNSVFPEILQTLNFCKTILISYNHEKSTNESKLIEVIKIFTVVFCCVLFSYTNYFNIKEN